MSDEEVKSLMERACRALDENRFSEAIALYRDAAQLRAPSRALVGNLAIAEEQERLAWRKALAASYPDSLLAQSAYLSALGAAHSPSLAIKAYGHLMVRFAGDAKAVLQLRVGRFKTSALRGPYETLVDDFLEIWKAGESLAPAQSFRAGLIAGLARLDHVEAVPALESLLERAGLPPPVEALATAKLGELRTLEAALAITRRW